MLTADLVVARRRKGELKLKELDAGARERIEGIAAAYLAALEGIGEARRGDVEAALDEVLVPARDRKIVLGIRKLVLDRCEFTAPEGVDPIDLRRRVFTDAAERRREHGTVDADAVLGAASEAFGLELEATRDALYADLRDAHRFVGFDRIAPAALVDGWELANLQSALLRATRVVATVEGSADQLRVLFRKLKFRRLLYTIERLDRGCRVTLDGPLSLFSQSTKYGLALALVLPAILACDRYRVDADIAWGKAREKLTLRLEGGGRGADPSAAGLPEDVSALLRRVQSAKSSWSVEAATDVLDLPGVGLCIPDLRFTHADTGDVVYLEVMGFWSRDAVWRRVELVEAGLPFKIVFAVSTRLRVSESVLDDDLPGALLVYKGTITAKALLDKLDSLAG